MKRRMGLIIVISVFGGMLLAVGYINPYSGRILLSELVLQLSGSRGDFNLGFSMHELLSLAIRMVTDFVLEMYLGVVLYRHFCTASVYVFSRVQKQIKWYFKEVLLLGMQVMVYQAILLITVILISVCKVQVQADVAGMFLLLYHFLLRSIWIFCMTLMINLISISFGSGLAFMVIMSMQALLITLLGIVKTIEKLFYADMCAFFLKWNPIARLVLSWQSSKLQVLKMVLDPPYSGLEVEISVLQYICLCFLVVLAGAVLVKKHDLIVSISEEGEV